MPSSSNSTRPGFTTQTQPSGLPLPFPIRVSAGFLVIGLSGKIRIQTLPPRFIARVSATRDASICRLVIQPGSRLISANSPNATVLPRVATPLVRPLKVLRNLIRFGASMASCPRAVGPAGHVFDHFTLTDPDLDPDRPVGGLGGAGGVVDVGPERVERHPALA